MSKHQAAESRRSQWRGTGGGKLRLLSVILAIVLVIALIASLVLPFFDIG